MSAILRMTREGRSCLAWGADRAAAHAAGETALGGPVERSRPLNDDAQRHAIDNYARAVVRLKHVGLRPYGGHGVVVEESRPAEASGGSVGSGEATP